MKKTICVLLMLALLAGLCACGRSPADGGQFVSAAEDLGLEAERLDSEGMNGVRGRWGAHNDDNSFTVFFYETDTALDAQRAFTRMNANLDALSGVTSSVRTNGFARISKTVGDAYYSYAYCGATYLYGETTKDRAGEMKALFKTLGY